ncbi:MAG: GNAT family N-acetyltransferase [Roseiflexaceae bacterium]|nr:GNAT family N-acetyltransferase [Roseiflexaceae bacterium]
MNDQQDKTLINQSISVALLIDNPHLISVIGEIRWKEWGHPPEPEDVAWWVDITRREAGRDRLPVTWVAIDQLGQAVGAVGLDTFDIPERRDRSPWVVGVVVAPLHRSNGIGGHMLATLELWAKNCGYPQAWVGTGGRAIAFYQKCGWELVESIHRPSGEEVSILTKVL